MGLTSLDNSWALLVLLCKLWLSIYSLHERICIRKYEWSIPWWTRAWKWPQKQAVDRPYWSVKWHKPTRISKLSISSLKAPKIYYQDLDLQSHIFNIRYYACNIFPGRLGLCWWNQRQTSLLNECGLYFSKKKIQSYRENTKLPRSSSKFSNEPKIEPTAN